MDRGVVILEPPGGYLQVMRGPRDGCPDVSFLGWGNSQFARWFVCCFWGFCRGIGEHYSSAC